MKTEARPLIKMFRTNVHYVVPKFQRRYVWTVENWTAMWDDIMKAARREGEPRARQGHFLGAVVLEEQPSRSTNTEVFRVVDGQQRLTTLQLLIAAAREVAAVLDLPPALGTSLERLCVNADETTDDPDDQLKVWPTTQDMPAFRFAMTHRSPELRERYNSVQPTVVQAYLHFVEAITGWARRYDVDSRAEAFQQLVNVVNAALHVVVIELDDDDNPQAIFESLNARGLPLQASDLVRNYLFRVADEKRLDAERLYAEHWERFDDGRWREETRRGRLSYPHMDAFLSDFLTIELREDVSPQQIYLAFRDYVDTATASTLTLTELMDRVAAYGDIYHSLDSATGSALSSYEKEFLIRLKALDTGAVMPVLMRLFVLYGTQAREPVLRVLDSYLWRRAIAQLTAQNYNNIMLGLLRVLDDAGGEPGLAASAYLASQSADSNFWPSDEDIRVAATSRQLDRLSSARLRQVLGVIEAALHTNHNENLHRDVAALTVEHLLPRASNRWPLRGVSARDRERAIHTLGNLTLLTERLNQGLSNAPWAQKLPAILRSSALNLNRELPSTWDEQRIADRGQRFVGILLAFFPRPGAAVNNAEQPELPAEEEAAEPVSPAPAGTVPRPRTIAGHIVEALRAEGPDGVLTVSQLARYSSTLYPDGANPNTIRDRLKRGTVSGVETTTNGNGYLAARLSTVVGPTDRMSQAASRLQPSTVLTPLELRFHGEMNRLCDRARSTAKFPLHGLRAMISARGGPEAARQLLAEAKVSDSSAELVRRGHPDLTVEALVLREEYATLFTETEKATAGRRLSTVD